MKKPTISAPLINFIKQLEVDNAYLRGMLQGMCMVQDINLPEMAVRTLELEHYEVEEALPDKPAIPQLVSVESVTEAPAEALPTLQLPEPVEAVETKPASPVAPKTPQEAVPWPIWNEATLTSEYKERLNLFRTRKSGPTGGGSILGETEEGTVGKLCWGCLEYRDIETKWGTSKNTKDGLSVYCKRCQSNYDQVIKKRKHWKLQQNGGTPVLRANEYDKKRPPAVTQRNCEECRLDKPLNIQNYRPIQFSDGHRDFSAYCLSCETKRDKKTLESVMKEHAVAKPQHQHALSGDK